tara:strand:- start:1290 stop:2087 length:798 start_codon:yes stop_codon:yes gene_type:complete
MGFCNNIKNYPAFNYGHSIDNSNRFINFSEDAGVTQLTAAMDIGSYTLQQYTDLIAKALNSAGDLEYTVLLDRLTRTFTISSTANFQLLVASGNNISNSAFILMGFKVLTDLTGSNVYTSDSASGSQYVLQTELKNFSDFPRNKEKAEAVKRTTPNGIVETISYGVIERMKCDIPMVTDITPQQYIRETNTGVQEIEDFLDYIIGINPIEFVYKLGEPNVFTNCIVDKTKSNSKGLGRELVERIKDKLPGYYEIKGLVFRKIEVR